MTEMLKWFWGCYWFALLDLFADYHQMPLAEEDMEKTLFVCREGTYHWTVMPFGLAGASGTFQRMMEEVLETVPEAQAYIDDISVEAPTFQKLLELLGSVLQRLADNNLRLLQKKCVVFVNEITLLGMKISAQGISIDSTRLADIQLIPEPCNTQQVRSLLGVFSFCRSFIPGYTELAALLHQLLKKNQLFR